MSKKLRQMSLVGEHIPELMLYTDEYGESLTDIEQVQAMLAALVEFEKYKDSFGSSAWKMADAHIEWAASLRVADMMQGSTTDGPTEERSS